MWPSHADAAKIAWMKLILAPAIPLILLGACQPRGASDGAKPGPAEKIDPQVGALLDEYEVPGAPAAFCDWLDAEVGPSRELTVTLRPGDEHTPNWVDVADKSQLPPSAQNAFIVYAFKKGGRRSAPIVTPLIVSGRMATGTLRCAGNFSTELFKAVLLIDEAQVVDP
jgi:hypothetical protein